MPSRLELDEAMMAPMTRLMPTHLRQGHSEMVRAGSGKTSYSCPWAWGGSYAVVYRFHLPGNRIVALRCFYRDVPAPLARRYQRLGELLAAQASEFTVPFCYHERGIRVRQDCGITEHPILEMEWVEGRTLLDEVDTLCQVNDSSGLARLAEKFVNLVLAMKRIRMAHGCLCGNDVMVRSDGRLVLVDYDGVYLPDPAITATPPGDRGNPDYEHPEHRSRPYDQHMDDFSALVIYVALLALRERPALFRQFVNVDSRRQIVGENLLFRADDFKDPARSRTFSELATLASPEVSRLADVLRNACRGPLECLSHFDNVVELPSSMA